MEKVNLNLYRYLSKNFQMCSSAEMNRLGGQECPPLFVTTRLTVTFEAHER